MRFLPASGLSAENVSKRTEGGPLSSWYDGPTLLEAIDSFQAAPRATDKPFRMCVADVTSSGKVRGGGPCPGPAPRASAATLFGRSLRMHVF